MSPPPCRARTSEPGSTPRLAELLELSSARRRSPRDFDTAADGLLNPAIETPSAVAECRVCQSPPRPTLRFIHRFIHPKFMHRARGAVCPAVEHGVSGCFA